MPSDRRLRPLGLIAAALLLGAAACGDTNIDSAMSGIANTGCTLPPDAGVDVTAPDAGPPQTTSPDAPPAPPQMSAIFLTQEQLRKVSGGNRQVDPKALHIFVGNRTRSCGDPFAAAGPYCDSWSFGFTLPPDLQKPGTWHVEDPALNFYYSQSGPDRGGGDCWGGGGNGFSFGDVTVVEITERFVVVRLTDVRTREWDGSGTYTVERCP